MVITIDGPSGVGKGEVGRRIASKFGYDFIDSGIYYRILTYEVIKRKLNFSDDNQIILFAKFLDFSSYSDDDYLHSNAIDNKVEVIADKPEIRKLINKYIVSIIKGDTVISGRDAGSLIVPNADYKFFLEGSYQERVNRRYKQSIEENSMIDYNTICRNIKERDNYDYNREYGRLMVPYQGIVINTNNLSIDETVKRIFNVVKVNDDGELKR